MKTFIGFLVFCFLLYQGIRLLNQIERETRAVVLIVIDIISFIVGIYLAWFNDASFLGGVGITVLTLIVCGLILAWILGIYAAMAADAAGKVVAYVIDEGVRIYQKYIKGIISLFNVNQFLVSAQRRYFRAMILKKKKNAIKVGIFENSDSNKITEEYEFKSDEGLSNDIPPVNSVFTIS